MSGERSDKNQWFSGSRGPCGNPSGDVPHRGTPERGSEANGGAIPLTATEAAEIREVAGHYPDPSAASIEALKIVQKHRGWVSDDSLKAVAELLDMSPADLDSVATFYNLIYRKPVGEKVIHYCNSVSCWMLGAEDIRAHISRRLGVGLGETTADGRFTLLPIVCLGACDHAPALMIGPEVYGDLDESRVDALLAEEGQRG